MLQEERPEEEQRGNSDSSPASDPSSELTSESGSEEAGKTLPPEQAQHTGATSEQLSSVLPPPEEEEEQEEEEELEVEAEIEEISPTQRRITGSVPAEKVQKFLRDSWEELQQSIQLRGFRKGRVPQRLLERRFGRTFYGELKQQLQQRVVAEVAQNYALHFYGEPEFARAELKEGQPFQFELRGEVIPDFALPPLEDIELVEEPISVSEEEIDRQIELLRERRAEWASTEKWPPGVEDQVVADLTVRASNKVLLRRENSQFSCKSNYLLDMPVRDLPERLCSGERTISVELQVPEDHPDERLRARRVYVEITLHEVKERVLPEVTDTFAGLFNCKDVAELREKTRQDLLASKKADQERQTAEKALEEILSRVDIPIPESLKEHIEQLAKEPQAASDRAAEASTSAGAEEETKPDPESVLTGFRRNLLLRRLADREGISLLESEVDRYLREAFGVVKEDVLREVKERLERSGSLREIHAELLLGKLTARIRSRCRIVKKEVPQATTGAAEQDRAGAAETDHEVGEERAGTSAGSGTETQTQEEQS